MITPDIFQQSGKKIPASFWHHWLEAFEKTLKIKGHWEISIAVVGDKAIQTLNRRYRGKDYITDVLSFKIGDIRDFYPTAGQKFVGEIIICYPQVVRQAKRNKVDFSAELAMLFIHGLLHLWGYDHQTERQYKVMDCLQEKILTHRK